METATNSMDYSSATPYVSTSWKLSKDQRKRKAYEDFVTVHKKHQL